MKLVTMTILSPLEKQCVHGIKGIFTVHGATLREIYLNENLKQLLYTHIFEKIIFLKPKGKRGEIEKIYSFDKEKCILQDKL